MLKHFRTYELAKALYTECQAIQVRHYVKDQLRRASLSVVLNLAEGSAKPTLKERRRFYAISLGSLREVQAILDLLGNSKAFTLADQVGGCLYRLVHGPKP